MLMCQHTTAIRVTLRQQQCFFLFNHSSLPIMAFNCLLQLGHLLEKQAVFFLQLRTLLLQFSVLLLQGRAIQTECRQLALTLGKCCLLLL